eukprot:2592973-Pleurochrysis_carterae.AAC.1
MLLESSESAKSTKLYSSTAGSPKRWRRRMLRWRQISARSESGARAFVSPFAGVVFGGDAPHIVSFAKRRGDDARVTVQDRLRVCNARRLREAN